MMMIMIMIIIIIYTYTYIYILINIEHIPNGFCTPFADDSPTLRGTLWNFGSRFQISGLIKHAHILLKINQKLYQDFIMVSSIA